MPDDPQNPPPPPPLIVVPPPVIAPPGVASSFFDSPLVLPLNTSGTTPPPNIPGVVSKAELDYWENYFQAQKQIAANSQPRSGTTFAPPEYWNTPKSEIAAIYQAKYDTIKRQFEAAHPGVPYGGPSPSLMQASEETATPSQRYLDILNQLVYRPQSMTFQANVLTQGQTEQLNLAVQMAKMYGTPIDLSAVRGIWSFVGWGGTAERPSLVTIVNTAWVNTLPGYVAPPATPAGEGLYNPDGTWNGHVEIGFVTPTGGLNYGNQPQYVQPQAQSQDYLAQASSWLSGAAMVVGSILSGKGIPTTSPISPTPSSTTIPNFGVHYAEPKYEGTPTDAEFVGRGVSPLYSPIPGSATQRFAFDEYGMVLGAGGKFAPAYSNVGVAYNPKMGAGEYEYFGEYKYASGEIVSRFYEKNVGSFVDFSQMGVMGAKMVGVRSGGGPGAFYETNLPSVITPMPTKGAQSGDLIAQAWAALGSLNPIPPVSAASMGQEPIIQQKDVLSRIGETWGNIATEANVSIFQKIPGLSEINNFGYAMAHPISFPVIPLAVLTPNTITPSTPTFGNVQAIRDAWAVFGGLNPIPAASALEQGGVVKPSAQSPAFAPATQTPAEAGIGGWWKNVATEANVNWFQKTQGIAVIPSNIPLVGGIDLLGGIAGINAAASSTSPLLKHALPQSEIEMANYETRLANYDTELAAYNAEVQVFKSNTSSAGRETQYALLMAKSTQLSGEAGALTTMAENINARQMAMEASGIPEQINYGMTTEQKKQSIENLWTLPILMSGHYISEGVRSGTWGLPDVGGFVTDVIESGKRNIAALPNRGGWAITDMAVEWKNAFGSAKQEGSITLQMPHDTAGNAVGPVGFVAGLAGFTIKEQVWGLDPYKETITRSVKNLGLPSELGAFAGGGVEVVAFPVTMATDLFMQGVVPGIEWMGRNPLPFVALVAPIGGKALVEQVEAPMKDPWGQAAPTLLMLTMAGMGGTSGEWSPLRLVRDVVPTGRGMTYAIPSGGKFGLTISNIISKVSRAEMPLETTPYDTLTLTQKMQTWGRMIPMEETASRLSLRFDPVPMLHGSGLRPIEIQGGSWMDVKDISGLHFQPKGTTYFNPRVAVTVTPGVPAEMTMPGLENVAITRVAPTIEIGGAYTPAKLNWLQPSTLVHPSSSLSMPTFSQAKWALAESSPMWLEFGRPRAFAQLIEKASFTPMGKYATLGTSMMLTSLTERSRIETITAAEHYIQTRGEVGIDLR